jgi:hypothetical protein
MVGLFALKPGERFAGAYEILRPLSEGGMGAVYVAKQLSTNKLRALKIMQPTLVGSPRLRERFAQEAKLGGLADSEHVVEAIDSGIEAERGIPWLAMELLVGETLGSRLTKRGAMTPAELSSIFRELCDGLGRAHAAGIVHRDLKPENVFLAKDKTGETVKILDFGIAKLAVEARTHSSLVLGTPLYMPPEQMIPGCAVTAATDVWPLALIAFQCLTGRVYWRSASQEGATPLMLLNEAAYLPMPAASERAGELGSEVTLPAGFDAWFQRCTDRDAKLRPGDASLAWSELEPLLSGGSGTVVVRPAASDLTSSGDVPTDVFLAERAALERSDGQLPEAATVPAPLEEPAPAVEAPTKPSAAATEPAASRAGAERAAVDAAAERPVSRRRWAALAAGVAATGAIGWLVFSEPTPPPPAMARVDQATELAPTSAPTNAPTAPVELSTSRASASSLAVGPDEGNAGELSYGSKAPTTTTTTNVRRSTTRSGGARTPSATGAAQTNKPIQRPTKSIPKK